MTPALSRILNMLALFAVCGVLIADFTFQFTKGELPCPLCLLQRIALIAVGFGVFLSLSCGVRPSHYGVLLLGAAYGGAVALAQIALHIVPGTGSYGSALLGYHLYTWSFLVFSAVLILAGLMLLFDRQFEQIGKPSAARAGGLGLAACLLLILLTLGNVLSTFLECGLAQCPATPVKYLMLEQSQDSASP
jgi:disulfide bond formation protein DsbB